MDFSLEQKQWSILLARFRKFEILKIQDLAGNVGNFKILPGTFENSRSCWQELEN